MPPSVNRSACWQLGVLVVVLGTSTPQVPPAPAPGVRNGHAMVYDSARANVLMFGGADATRVLADLWAWDGHAWVELAPNGPPARTFPALAFDRARHTLLLFGGNRVLFGDGAQVDTMLNDTWIWSGGQWRELQVAGPGARAEAAVTYDSHRQRIVIFGGYRRSPTGNIRLGDTWEWDGDTWEQRAITGPSPRNGAAFVFDRSRRRAVLFGGAGGARDTWEWDGIQWRQRDAGEVPGRYNAAMTYAGDTNTILRFGGWTGTTRASDTWVLGRSGWARLEAEGPVGRNHSALVYDEVRKKSVLFGGHDDGMVFGDTWEWDGQRWQLAAFVPAERRVNNRH